jgi:hypothetical protein
VTSLGQVLFHAGKASYEERVTKQAAVKATQQASVASEVASCSA